MKQLCKYLVLGLAFLATGFGSALADTYEITFTQTSGAGTFSPTTAISFDCGSSTNPCTLNPSLTPSWAVGGVTFDWTITQLSQDFFSAGTGTWEARATCDGGGCTGFLTLTPDDSTGIIYDDYLNANVTFDARASGTYSIRLVQTPEPGAVLLLLTGLAGLGLYRRKRQP